ncbi:MAG: hypothetical protein NVSMB27_35140 [Ktedonobacteraceae bacterium]
MEHAGGYFALHVSVSHFTPKWGHVVPITLDKSNKQDYSN